MSVKRSLAGIFDEIDMHITSWAARSASKASKSSAGDRAAAHALGAPNARHALIRRTREPTTARFDGAFRPEI
jgi:hypothetical protein